MREFDWERFQNTHNRIVVHCKTLEEAKDFCNQMHERGLTWCNGLSYLEGNNYSTYGYGTCYSSRGTYAARSFYKQEDYEIIKWSDYMISTENNRCWYNDMEY